jgi:hypothetical protein
LCYNEGKERETENILPIHFSKEEIDMLLKYKDVISTLDASQKERIVKAFQDAGIKFWASDQNVADLGIIRTCELSDTESDVLTTYAVRTEDAHRAIEAIMGAAG